MAVLFLFFIVLIGINFTVAMTEMTKVFREMGAHLLNRHLPGCERFPLKRSQYFE